MNADGAVTVAGVVEIVEPLGAETLVTVTVAGERLQSRFPPRSGIALGETVELRTDPSHLHLFDADSGARVPTQMAEEAVTTAGQASNEG
jgi:ABC-type sugar transport system ATPase subunit